MHIVQSIVRIHYTEKLFFRFVISDQRVKSSVSNHPICQNSQISWNSDALWKRPTDESDQNSNLSFHISIKIFYWFSCFWMKSIWDVDNRGKCSMDEESLRRAFFCLSLIWQGLWVIIHLWYVIYIVYLFVELFVFCLQEESELRDISGLGLCWQMPEARIRWAGGWWHRPDCFLVIH